jgi:hypothetical protein
MKIEVIPQKEKGSAHFKLILRYEPCEWRKLENFYMQRGLEKKQIRNLFGKWISVEAYVLREKDQGLLSALDVGIEREISARTGIAEVRLIDDLNDRLLYYYGEALHVNIALFRIVPKDGVVELELPADVVSDFDHLSALAIAVKHIVKTLAIYDSKFRVKFEIVVEPVG